MTKNTTPGPDKPANEQPLESWKEIAAYLQRGVRTVKRWEQSEGLPVRRHVHQSRSSVYASPAELDAWRASRGPVVDNVPEGWLARRPVRNVAFAAMLLVAVLAAGDARLIGRASAAAESQDVTTRRVWAGSEVDMTGSMSPDGRWFTFVDWTTGDLAIRDLVSGQNRHLTNKDWKGSWAGAPEEALWSVFSPDSMQVAYAWQPNRKNYDLRVVGIQAGATPRILYANPDVDLVQPMDWSADGKQIIATFMRNDRTWQIAAVTVADGSVRVLKSLDWRSPQKVSLSPDGRYIAYDLQPKETARERDIFVLATDGSGETAVVQHAADDRVPVWTPEGDRILFVSDRTGSPSLWSIAVSQGKPQGAPELLKADVGRLSGPIGLTRDRALYLGVSVGLSEVQTARLDPAVGTVLEAPVPLSQRFVGSTGSLDWSPDGKSLAYLVRGRVIVIRSLATGDERELKPDVRFWRPIWSPDSRSFLANGFDAKGHQGLLRIDAATGAVTLLVQAKLYIAGQARSQDGKGVFYCDNGHVMRYDIERGDSEPIAPCPSAPSVNFAVSPDGQSVAVFRGGRTLDVVSAKSGETRELVRLQDGEEMTSDPATAWTPDGKYVLFTKTTAKSSDMTLWSVPAGGGAPNRIALTMPALRDLRMNPDGTRIAFTAGQDQPEVWVIEHLLPAPKAAQ